MCGRDKLASEFGEHSSQHCASCSARVTLRKLLCASCSAQVALRKRSDASCSARVALRRMCAACKLLCASCSAQVALCKLLCASCFVQVAPCKCCQSCGTVLCGLDLYFKFAILQPELRDCTPRTTFVLNICDFAAAGLYSACLLCT